jgi:hypothetical protein
MLAQILQFEVVQKMHADLSLAKIIAPRNSLAHTYTHLLNPMERMSLLMHGHGNLLWYCFDDCSSEI